MTEAHSLYREDIYLKYKSGSQRIRSMSELWLGERMYCPACPSDGITPFENNKPVSDFFCPDCGELFQLKSQSKPFVTRVTDGAYDPMMNAVRSGALPNFFFLHYNKDDFSVIDLLLIPRFFFSDAIIEKRNPLSSTARRAGWQGCNILYGSIAREGKIPVIIGGNENSKESVRESWRRVNFLEEKTIDAKGWINDILWCVNKIGKTEFTLNDVYAFEGHLKKRHPDNNNVLPKIRQQLQMLRDKGLLEFVSPGVYRVV